MTSKKIKNIAVIILFIVLCILCFVSLFRIDLTSDKRYSISPQTRKLMQEIETPLYVTIYLDGDLNPGFLRLKRATSELFEELSLYANFKLNIRYDNPSSAGDMESRERKYEELEERGMTPTMVYELDKEGKRIQKIIYPWVELNYNGKTSTVNLLKNIRGNSGEENLNISVENLEYEITDAIRRLILNKVTKIAFIEGHGELSEQETYDISIALSRYFQIDRGALGNDASILNEYKAIIIAKPETPFSEADKYIIDQYIMNGGRVLWLVDGVRISRESLSTTGQSPAIGLDVNLGDMLFRYGVRINPVVLEDVQSVRIPVNIAPPGEQPQFESMPWFYSPLLLTSYIHPVTRNVAEVKADFSSSVDLVGENEKLDAYLLLATSTNTHILRTPATIDLADFPSVSDIDYFNAYNVPVAVSLEGVFSSVFTNRIIPPDIVESRSFKKESVATRQIIVADGDIIRNDISGDDIVPLGYDRFMDQQFGNKDFIQNAVLYLTDNEGWMDLRSREVNLSLLNKRLVLESKTFWQILNLAVPVFILIVLGFVYQIIRKRSYTK